MASLKGIIAIYIMFYHYYAWGVEYPADWGVNLAQFGVVLFFTMSGYGLSQSYRGTVDWRRYWVRRVRRIAPLFWVATFLSLITMGWLGSERLALNLTFLWPIVNLRWSIPTGGWAIGCEVAFYVMFWVWGILGFRAWLGWAVAVLSMAYGFVQFSPEYTLIHQWEIWINPLVQASAFFGGAMLVPRMPVTWAWPLLWVVACLALPTPWAISWFRPLLVVAGCGIVATVAKWQSPADFLGKYSYQIYLLHPIAWDMFLKTF